MTPQDPSQLLNRLIDQTRAAEIRCAGTAAGVRDPQLQALLLLRAAEHGADAQKLHDLVVEMRGTPTAGETAALVADPLHDPIDGDADARLLGHCLDEEQAQIDELQRAASDEDLPRPVQSTLGSMAAASIARLKGLREAAHRP